MAVQFQCLNDLATVMGFVSNEIAEKSLRVRLKTFIRPSVKPVLSNSAIAAVLLLNPSSNIAFVNEEPFSIFCKPVSKSGCAALIHNSRTLCKWANCSATFRPLVGGVSDKASSKVFLNN